MARTDLDAPDAPVIRAHRTLEQGSRFLTERTARVGRPMPAKVIGNALRELDRFLDVLVLELGRGLRVDVGTRGPRTAQRIGCLRAAIGIEDPDGLRLRALGRSRSCLYYSEGRVVRGDARGAVAMTSGWHVGCPRTTPLRRVAVGALLAVSAAELAEAAAYYGALGDRLIVEAGRLL